MTDHEKPENRSNQPEHKDYDRSRGHPMTTPNTPRTPTEQSGNSGSLDGAETGADGRDHRVSTERVPVLWFDRKGCGPDELALELHPFPSEMDGAIPASLGIRVRAGELVISADALVDGGFNLGREQVETLHRLLGEWLVTL